MSLLRRHIAMINFVTPSIVRVQGTGYSASSSWAFTITVTPIEGNLIVLSVGGSQARTLAISGSGWTQSTMTGSNNALSIFYKIAGASEATSITITITGGTLQGSIEYYEIQNTSASPFLQGGVGNPFSTATSQNFGTFNVTVPSIWISNICFSNSLAMWVPNNSFNPLQAPGTVGRHTTAYKIYSNPVSGEDVTWSGSSNSGGIGMIGFSGKII